MSSDTGLKMLLNGRAAFRAVLEGAGYNNLDALGGMSTDTCRMIGEDAKAATLKIIEQRDQLLVSARIIMADLNARIDEASAKGLPVPVFNGIADLHDAINKATT